MILKRLLILTLFIPGLRADMPVTNDDAHELSWQRLLTPWQNRDNDLKRAMKGQLIQDLIYTGCSLRHQGHASMLVEVISRRMNSNDSHVLSRDALCVLLAAHECFGIHASPCAALARDVMTIADGELNRAKEILSSVTFTRDINGALAKSVTQAASECKEVPCDTTPEQIEQRLQEGSLTEEQIVSSMHMQMLVRLLASVLLAERGVSCYYQ